MFNSTVHFSPTRHLLPSYVLEFVKHDLAHNGPGNFWRKLDEFRMREKPLYQSKGQWPDSVFMPEWLFKEFMDGWSEEFRKSKIEHDWETFTYFRVLADMVSWRPAQDVVRFEKGFCDLMQIDLEKTSASIFSNLPAWNVYFDTPGIVIQRNDFIGFHARQDIYQDKRFLQISFSSPSFCQYACIPITDAPLSQMLAELERGRCESSNGTAPSVIVREFMPYLKLIIYLCGEGFPDQPQRANGKIQYPLPKKVNNISRFFPPDKPRIHRLGLADALSNKVRSGRLLVLDSVSLRL